MPEQPFLQTKEDSEYHLKLIDSHRAALTKMAYSMGTVSLVVLAFSLEKFTLPSNWVKWVYAGSWICYLMSVFFSAKMIEHLVSAHQLETVAHSQRWLRQGFIDCYERGIVLTDAATDLERVMKAKKIGEEFDKAQKVTSEGSGRSQYWARRLLVAGLLVNAIARFLTLR